MIKRKFYKDVWFYLFVVVALFSIFMLVGASSLVDDNDAQAVKIKKQKKEIKGLTSALNAFTSDNSGDDDDYASDDESDGKTLSYSEPATFDSGEKITINSVKDGGTLAKPKPGEHAVTLNVTVENTKSDPLDFNPQNFDVYDSNDELTEFDANTYDSNVPHSIAGSKKATMDIIFGAKNHGPYSVTFGDVTWNVI